MIDKTCLLRFYNLFSISSHNFIFDQLGYLLVLIAKLSKYLLRVLPQHRTVTWLLITQFTICYWIPYKFQLSIIILALHCAYQCVFHLFYGRVLKQPFN